MKKIILCILGLLMAGLINTAPVFAADVVFEYIPVYTYSDMDIEAVGDIDNCPFPETKKYGYFDGIKAASRFTLDAPAVVKVTFVFEQGAKISGDIWFSRDKEGLDVIGNTTAVRTQKAVAGIFLDPGTYYINHKVKSDKKDTSGKSFMGVCLQAEYIRSDETVASSDFVLPNTIKTGQDVYGFISETTPSDYYRFKISEYGRVKIRFNFKKKLDAKTDGGLITIYDRTGSFVKNARFRSSYADNFIDLMLEPGDYYAVLSGVTGPTYLSVSETSYVPKVSLSVIGENKYSNEGELLSVSCEFEPREILLVKGKVTDANIKGNMWSTRSGALDITSAQNTVISENGDYTLRITDRDGNMVLKSFSASHTDKTAPTVAGVEDGAVYKKAVTIKFADANLLSATLNGKKISTGKKVSAKGSYTLIVTDRAGNETTVKFKIKK